MASAAAATTATTILPLLIIRGSLSVSVYCPKRGPRQYLKYRGFASIWNVFWCLRKHKPPFNKYKFMHFLRLTRPFSDTPKKEAMVNKPGLTWDMLCQHIINIPFLLKHLSKQVSEFQSLGLPSFFSEVLLMVLGPKGLKWELTEAAGLLE